MFARRSFFLLLASAVVLLQFAAASAFVSGGSAAAPAQALTVFDFTSNICSAVWWSGAGRLPCPLADGDARGYVLKVDHPVLETGVTDTAAGLVVGPQNKFNGYIQGFFPEYTVQAGDHFQTSVGCASGSACFVTYRLDYRINGGAINILWTWKEANEGRIYQLDKDLSALAGKKVSFILTMLASGPATGDRAIWGQPRIVGAGLPGPSPTPIPTPDGFLNYTNTANAFQFSYPPDAALSDQSDSGLRINLSIAPDTNLVSKYLNVVARQSSGECKSNLTGTQSQVTINGLVFTRQVGQDNAQGQRYDRIAYSTMRGNVCVTFDFFMHWSPAANWTPPRPEFDRAAESAVFEQMVRTFAWLPEQPAASVTNVTVAAAPTFTACGGPNVVGFSGSITTDGPADVTYHWEVGGDATAGTPDQQLTFSGAGAQAINTDAFKADCGSYFVKLVVTAPNSTSAQADFVIEGETPSPTPTVTSGPPTSEPPAGTTFDFTSNICAAKWWSGAGQLACPMADGASNGYAVVINNPLLEDGSTDSLPGLNVGPQNKTNGYLQGFFPEYTVQAGDHFQAAVGCANGSSCFVTYRLDYRINGGAINILWSWKEANDGKIYNVDYDLSALAGKKVSFILTLLATGSPAGDRAIWAHPRIFNSGPTPTSTPTPTGSPEAGLTLKGTVRLHGTGLPGVRIFRSFAAYSGTLVATTGEDGSYQSAFVPIPGDETVSVWAELDGYTFDPAMVTGMHYHGLETKTIDFAASVVVPPTPPPGTSLSFTSDVCSAKWWSGTGQLACPMADRASTGYALVLNNPVLEDGTTDSLPGLVVGPQNKTDGYIQGFYPDYTVQAGDHFQAAVGCANGSSCFVTYRLDYRINGGAIKILWTWKEASDGKIYNVDYDLSALAGKKVSLILTLLASGSSAGDRAIWAHPHLVNIPPPPPPTPTPISGWQTYVSANWAYQFQYPAGGNITSDDGNTLWLYLPIQPDTDLTSKFLIASARDTGNGCQSYLDPDATIHPETIVVNGLTFLKWSSTEQNMNSLYKTTQYAVERGTVCVTLGFTLRSGLAFDPMPPPYNAAAESVVFTQMLSTFRWLTITPTPTPTPTAMPSSTVQVYFYKSPELLVQPVDRVTGSPNLPEAALLDLFQGPTPDEQALGLVFNASGATGFSNLAFSGDVASVYLAGNCNSGGSTFTIASLIRPTLMQFAGINHVRIYDQNGNTENPDPTTDSIPACLEP